MNLRISKNKKVEYSQGSRTGGLALKRSLLSVLVFFVLIPMAFAASPVGQVKKISGHASVVHDGVSIPLTLGSMVYENDVLSTEKDGSCGVTFIDNSTLSLGPGSLLEIDDLVYDPVKDNGQLSLHVLKGTLSYVSGDIVKGWPDNASVTTPTATIGIRGTRFVIRVEKKR